MLCTLRQVVVLGALACISFLIAACGGIPEDVVKIESAAVDRIKIERFDERIVLEKENDVWFVREPVEVEANPVTVENLLMTLDQLTVEEVASTSAEEYSSYGVDSNAPVLTIEGSGLSQTFRVGRGGQEIDLQFIRVDEGEDVYLARGRLNTTMRVDVWRNRLIVDLDPAIVEEISFVEPDGTYRLENTESGWQLIESGQPRPADASLVEEWLAFFTPLRTDGFAPIAPELVRDNGDRRIEFGLADGSVTTVYFLDVGAEYAVVADGNVSVFHVFAMRVNSFFPGASSFQAEVG